VDQGFYGEAELSSIPELARNLSRGCGNPSGFANLQLGEVVVDFGCGGGIDVILAAHKVGLQGKVVGIDFAEQMIEQAKQAVVMAGLQHGNIEFFVDDMEQSQIPDSLADVVMSNCVINLCPNKDAVYREVFRILKPGGRIAISDIVITEHLDTGLRERFQSTWAGCLGGSVPEKDYFETVSKAGFVAVQIVVRHTLTDEELEAMACCPGGEFTPAPAKDDLAAVKGKVSTVKFTAMKPF
jgi:2-polyprenyl-3-methyl-5-hydroxy-6-metoxy-1,4-benzoquinol methylase